MGGAAGHIKNAWELTDMTFGEVRGLIHQLVANKIPLTEKLDGQNIMLTWRNNDVYVARTSKHLKNYGENAIKGSNIQEFFGPNTPENVKLAYALAVDDFKRICERDSIGTPVVFDEGKYWANIEILNEDTENIIHYGVKQLRVHNVIEVSVNGLKLGPVEKLYNVLFEDLLGFYDGELNYEILPVNNVSVKEFEKRMQVEAMLHMALTKLQLSRGLNDDDTLGYYLILSCEQYIMDHAPNIIEAQDRIDSFTKRWVYGDKKENIRSILNGASPEVDAWFRKEDKNPVVKKMVAYPLIVFFLQLGIVILRNLDGIVAKDSDTSRKVVMAKVSDALGKIKAETDPEEIGRLMYYMRMLKDIGDLNSITPTEGVVFKLGNDTVKLTGAFGPILQLIAHFKYGKK